MEPSLDTTRVPAGRRPVRRLLLALGMAFGLLLAALLVLLFVLQVPPVRALVLDRAASWARAHLGLELRAGGLDYAVLPPVVDLSDIVLASTTSPAQPFFTAERVQARLSWRALLGHTEIEALTITRPAITIAWQPDGTSNLPAADQTTTAETARPREFFIRNLQVNGLDALIGTTTRSSPGEARSGTTLAMRDVEIALRSDRPQWLEGVVTASQGMRLDLEDAAIIIDRATASLTFDGRRVALRSLDADAAGGTIRATGSLTVLGEPARVDVDVTSNVDLSRLSTWFEPVPPLTGSTTLRAKITGPPSRPVVAFDLEGQDLGWGRLAASTLKGSGSLDVDGLNLGSFTVALAGGTLRGRGLLAFGNEGPSTFEAQWSDLDSQQLATLLTGQPAVLPALTTSGRADLTWTGPGPSVSNVAGTVDATARLGARVADNRLTEPATFRASGARGQWRVTARQPLGGNTTIALDAVTRVSGDAWASAPIDGTAAVLSEDAVAALGGLRAFGVAVPDLGEVSVGGPSTFEGRLSGTLAAPRLAGTLSLVDVAVPQVAPLQIHAQITADRLRLDVAPLLIEGPSARAEARASVPLGSGPMSGTFSVNASDLSALLPGLNPSLRPDGALTLSGDLAGTLRDPLVTVSFSAEGFTVGGTVLDRVDGRLNYRDAELSAQEVSFEQGARGRGRMQGSVGLDGTLRAVTVTGTELHIGPVPLRGTTSADEGQASPAVELSFASVDGEVSGTVESLNGRVAATTTRTLLYGRDLGPADASAVLTNGQADIRVRSPGLAAVVEGQVSTRDPFAVDVRVTLADTNLTAAARLMASEPAAAPRIEGILSADGRLAGLLSDFSTIVARIDLTRLEGTVAGLPIRLRAPAHLLADAGVPSVRDLVLDLGGLSARLDGTLAAGSSLTMTIDGPIEALKPWMATLDPDHAWVTRGRIDAVLEARGPASALEVTGRARGSVAELTRGNWSVVKDLSFDAVLDTRRIQFTRVQGTIVDSQVDATASAPTAWLMRAWPASIRLSGGEPDLAAAIDARVLVDVPALLRSAGQELPADVTGSLSGVARATATRPALDAIVGDVVFDQAGFVGFDQRFTQRQPTRLTIADGRMTVEACEFSGLQSRFTAAGTIGFVAGTFTDFRIEGDSSLRIVDLLLPGRAVGRTRVDVRFTGSPGAVTVSGDVALKNASLLLPHSRFSLADWSGTIRFSPDHLEVRDLRGQLNGGDVSIQGRLAVARPGAAGTPTASTDGISLEARGVFLEVPRGLRSQADASLAWTRTGTGSIVGGTITLVSSTYREPVTKMLELVDGLAGAKGSGGSGWEIPEPLEDVALDVALTSNDPAVFENSLGRVEMVPNLRMVGTLGAPALSGTIDTLENGRLRIGGRVYRLRESTLRFSPVDGLVPTLNVVGETRIGEYDVTTRITGTPTSVETNFTSDPPLPERDLRSLVVTGRTESAQAIDAGSSNSFAVAAASTDVLGFAGQFVGLDSVRLGAADLELVSADVKPAQHLTISKSLGQKFEVIVSENLEDNSLTWVFVWRPSSRFQIRLSSRENTEQAIEFRHEVPFGPGARPAGPARSTSQARKSRVAAVNITGNPGFARDIVLAQLELTAGKPFDFRRWVEDRDRLERFYRDQSYFAARIVPTRSEQPDAGQDPSVTLEYRILRGPRTELVVEGADLPGRVLEEMKAAWADAPVPEFARGDLVRIARAFLVDDGYLRAEVEAIGGDAQAGRSRIVLRIEPGAQFSRRALAFSGNEAIPAEELRRFADQQDLDRTAWSDPQGLIRSFEDQYALRGYLRARVIVDPPRFDGDQATLPVRIVEGPRATVTEVVIGGVGPGRDAEVQKALGLAVGDAYVRHAERSARQRLDEHYRGIGYRDAKATVRAHVSDDGARVSIEGRVEEGPLHVVRQVRVTGVESANPSVVDRAITLEPGSPASQSAVAETRKRLYDTGIFRSADIQFQPVQDTPGDAQDQWPVDAVVAVEEARRYLLRYGLEFSTEYDSRAEGSSKAFGVSADLRDRNFLGRGLTAGVGGHYEPGLRSVRSLLSVPRFFGRPILSNAYATWRYESDDVELLTLDDNRIDVTLEQRVRLRSRLELTWGYTYGWRRFNFVQRDGGRLLLDLSGVLAGLSSSAVLDYRDNPFDATRGWLHSSSVQWGLEALGSELGYGRYLLRQFHYVPLGPLVLAGAARWGTIAAFGGNAPVTVIDQLFTAGGSTTVRGYREEELSALEFFGVPIGGTELLIFNGEVRFPLLKWIKGVAFADAGNTFRGQSDVRLSGLAVGLGVGVRIKTPLAPIRVDLGFPSPRRPGDPKYRWHFSVGQMF